MRKRSNCCDEQACAFERPFRCFAYVACVGGGSNNLARNQIFFCRQISSPLARDVQFDRNRIHVPVRSMDFARAHRRPARERKLSI